MNYIKSLHIEGFKKFTSLDVEFNEHMNILVGENEAGKSTILDAIKTVLNQQYRNADKSILRDLFNTQKVAAFKAKPSVRTLPRIYIEVPMNTKISYLYRDADNYKMHNKCVIAGTLTTEQARTIKDSCEMGEYFIPRQVGLPERRFDRYDPAVDHCWFELDEDCFSETIEPPTVALTATELVNRFEGCKNNWRDEAYTPQMGGMKF